MIPGKYQLFKGNRNIIDGEIENILLDPFGIRCLNLFCKYANCSISVSGSWQKHKNPHEIKRIFKNNGFCGGWYNSAVFADGQDHSEALILKSNEDCFLEDNKHSDNEILIDELDGVSYSDFINILNRLGVDIGTILEGEFF